MLIRIYNDEVLDFPDELAARILAMPISTAIVPDYSIEEVNALIHGVLGALFEEELTFEQNIAAVQDSYVPISPISASNLAKAHDLIVAYNKGITIDKIGYVSTDLAFPFGGNNYHPQSEMVIEQMPNTEANLPVSSVQKIYARKPK